MNFDIEELRLIPEDFVHSVSLHALKSHEKKLNKKINVVRIIDSHNSIKHTQTSRLEHMAKQLEDIKEAIGVLVRDKEVRARRARLRVI